MRSLSLFRGLTASLLVAAVLLQAVLPLLGMQRGGEGRGHWIEVCASSGVRWIRLPEAGKPAPASSEDAEHPCAFCVAGEPPERFDASAWLARLPEPSHDTAKPADECTQRFAGHQLRARAPPFFA